MKKFLIAATLAITTLTSAALLAQSNEQDHARHQDKAVTENQTGDPVEHGRMQRMHEQMAQRDRGSSDKDRHHGRGAQMQRGHADHDCPMREPKKPS
jgi:hypothetical protein